MGYNEETLSMKKQQLYNKIMRSMVYELISMALTGIVAGRWHFA